MTATSDMRPHDVGDNQAVLHDSLTLVITRSERPRNPLRSGEAPAHRTLDTPVAEPNRVVHCYSD